MADKFVKLTQLGRFFENLKNVFVQKDGAKVLSTNDYTDAEKTKLAGIETNANNYSLPTASETTLGGVKVGTNLVIANGVLSADLSSKVDKVAGKGLSTQDYTTAEKTKLAGLSNYTLPVATVSVLGGVKAGDNVTIAEDGTISAVQGTVDLTPYAKKASTLSGYGITDAKIVNGVITLGEKTITPLTEHQSLDAYAKTADVANTYATKASLSDYATVSSLENYAKKSDVASAVLYKGSVDNYSDLPKTGMLVGWMYNIANADSIHGISAGDNVVYNGTDWDNYNGTIVIDAATDSDIDGLFA